MVLRHGEAAFDASSDAQRPLTRRGKLQTQTVLQRRAAELAKIDCMVVSPLRRARETAALALPFTAPQARLLISELLIPEGTPGALLAFLAEWSPQRCLLVGHQPLAGRLVAVMTGRKSTPLDLATSALVGLEVFAWCEDGAQELWWEEPGRC